MGDVRTRIRDIWRWWDGSVYHWIWYVTWCCIYSEQIAFNMWVAFQLLNKLFDVVIVPLEAFIFSYMTSGYSTTLWRHIMTSIWGGALKHRAFHANHENVRHKNLVLLYWGEGLPVHVRRCCCLRISQPGKIESLVFNSRSTRILSAQTLDGPLFWTFFWTFLWMNICIENTFTSQCYF